MKLKYQETLEINELTGCPPAEIKEVQVKAYRWVHDPISNNLNFLPNHLYDIARNRPPRALTKDDLCDNLNLSFYTDLDFAYSKLKNIVTNFEKKHKSLITTFYSHIAEGNIEKTDGLATKEVNKHFGFYEYDGIDLSKKFVIVAKIS